MTECTMYICNLLFVNKFSNIIFIYQYFKKYEIKETCGRVEKDTK